VFDDEFTTNTIKIFAAVMTNLISNNLRLDIVDSTDLKYVLGYYYASIMFPDKDHDHKLILTAKATASINKVDDVENLLKNVPDTITSVEDLIYLMKNNLLNSRAAKLNVVTMQMIAGSMLFGSEVKQFLTVSLENSFVFMTLVYNAYINRLYKRTPLASVLSVQGRFLDIKEYADKISVYIKDIK
jgi:hypothetical protein